MFRARDAADAAEIVSAAFDASRALEVVAGGSKRALGQPFRPAARLEISALAGVVDYDPAELVLTAQAATPLAQIETILAEQRQMLSFEPPDWRALLGHTGAPTLGGTIACNLAGPRRVRAGAARDHTLGFAAIDGRGQAWRAGGRVVKNVTGYDMCKLQCGAFGTLSVLTELSVRVMPKPETSANLLFAGLDDAAAIRLASRALNTPHEVSAVAHLPLAAARRAGFDSATTVIRVEGPAPSVSFRVQALRTLLGDAAEQDPTGTLALWHSIGGVHDLLPDGPVLWRVCCPPAAAPSVLAAVQAEYGDAAEAYYDWGGGLVWLSLDAAAAGFGGGAAIVRAALRQASGHATLFLAPPVVRAVVPAFEPQPAPLAALSARVKAGFDPRGILNPGRMVLES